MSGQRGQNPGDDVDPALIRALLDLGRDVRGRLARGGEK